MYREDVELQLACLCVCTDLSVVPWEHRCSSTDSGGHPDHEVVRPQHEELCTVLKSITLNEGRLSTAQKVYQELDLMEELLSLSHPSDNCRLPL